MAKRSVLFLCTGNCCRSPLAEAICRHIAGDRFDACSAGSTPAGFTHPLTLTTLDDMGIDSEGLESKSWYDFVETPIDIAITVCDSAANEACPTFPGAGIKAHWPLPDPSFYAGTEQEQLDLCRILADRLMLKIKIMAQLDLDAMDAATIKDELDKLADI